jgi:sulfur-oxidizing protein SoxA
MRRARRPYRAAIAAFAIGIGGMSAMAQIAPSERRSGYADLAPETKSMQDDDTANPAMLSVLDGEALWSTKTGSANLACADCHGKAEESMKGVAARYPAYDRPRGKPVDLEQRVNICRVQHQKASPWKPESKDLLALAAYVGLQSRSMPIAVGDDARLKPFIAAGEKLFTERQGQLNLSCAQCHDARWGKHLGSSLIPQAHPTGYPIYRLEWQSVGSLQRRLRNCITGMRAQAFDYDALENVELELFLMMRARGMPLETPAVRP